MKQTRLREAKKLEDMVRPLKDQPLDRRFIVTSDNEWILRKNRELEHRTMHYFVDLDRCSSSAAVLDWLFQVFKKRWCTQKTLRDLMVQLQARIDPQATLCSNAIVGTQGKGQTCKNG